MRLELRPTEYSTTASTTDTPSKLAPQVYSTVLWHLKREVELSFLAQEMLALDRLSPQAW
jgi:hypothetical protein